jgi:excisionase family DNA binding protein
LSSITNSDSPLTRLLTADDVAAAAQVSKDRVWELTREGKLPTVKLGPRTYRYRPEQVERAIAEMEE